MIVERGSTLKKVRPQVVPKRQLRPQMLRKATRFCLHSSLVRICLYTRKSITIPDDTSRPRTVMLVKQNASQALFVATFIQHLKESNTQV